MKRLCGWERHRIRTHLWFVCMLARRRCLGAPRSLRSRPTLACAIYSP